MTNDVIQSESKRLPVLGSESVEALALGRLVEPGYGVTNPIRYGGDKHILVVGPNGKGKGTRILMPNLLQLAGNKSIVVLDQKGELAAVTAPFRRTLGRVVIINPFGVHTDTKGYEDLRSCGFNPLAALDPGSSSFNTQASMLADALVTIEGKDPHWSTSARALIAALIMYVTIEARTRGEVPKFSRLRELLCEPSEARHAGNDYEGVGLPKRAAEMMRSKHPGLRNKAAQFTEWNREVQSIASTARIQTEAFDDVEIAADLEKDGFDFRDLKREPITVYLILPPEMMRRHSKWLRLILTTAILGVLRARKEGEPRALFMLDEFFALGHLEIIETVWALVRGYGIQIMPVLQDLGQLKKLYPELWETFKGMAGAEINFGPNDLTTAEHLSRRAGDTTRTARSHSSSYSKSKGTNLGMNSGGTGFGSNSSGTSENESYSRNSSSAPVKVPLMTPHDFFGLKEGFVTVTLDGGKNIVPVYLPAYYQLRKYLRRARDNPYHLG